MGKVDPHRARREQLFAAAPKDRIAKDLLPLARDLGRLAKDVNNAREHPERNLLEIMESLAKFGQMKPVVVRQQTMVVVAGNGTLEAAARLGWSRIAAVVEPMTDADAASYGLADNRTGESSRWREEVVARLEKLIADSGDEVVGWSRAEVLAMRCKYNTSTDDTTTTTNNGSAVNTQVMVPQFNVMVECESEAEQLAVLQELTGRGHRCRALTS